jgi:hypothetical protein
MAAGMMQTVKVHAMAGMDHGGHDMDTMQKSAPDHGDHKNRDAHSGHGDHH